MKRKVLAIDRMSGTEWFIHHAKGRLSSMEVQMVKVGF